MLGKLHIRLMMKSRNAGTVMPRRLTPLMVGMRGSSQPQTAPLSTNFASLRFDKDVGTKQVAFASEVLLEQEDLKLMKTDEEITLMAWGNAIVRDIQGGSDTAISSATAELNLQGDVKKTEKKVTWLATQGQKLIPAELWDFDYLLTKDKLEEDDDVEQFLNPETASMEDAWCAETMADVKKDDIIQLERKGYYRVDKGLGDWTDKEAGEKGRRIILFCIPTGKAN